MTNCKQCLADHEARLSGVQCHLLEAQNRAARLEEVLKGIEDSDADWSIGVDENLERLRTAARSALSASSPILPAAQGFPAGSQIGMVAAKGFPADLMALWNREAHKDLPKAKGLSPGREKSCRARLRERPLDTWIEIINRINASAFCRGENDRGWKASFDWLLRPDTAFRVSEGKYDDRKPVKTSRPIGRDYDAASNG